MVEAKKSKLSQVPKPLLDKFKSHDQEHVFKFVNDLSSEQLRKFIEQLEGIDLDLVIKEFKEMQTKITETEAELETQTQVPPSTPRTTTQIKPLPTNMLLENNHDPELWKEGLDAITAGHVAVVTLAGGQGTRLGSSAPKGCYNIGLPSGMSLFQLQAWRLRRLAKLAKVPSIPWFIMTSPATHAETEEFFKKNKYFGLTQETIQFFQQGELPALTKDGMLIMKSKWQLAMSPNGNGGVYSALLRHGIIDELKSKGIKWVHLYCVDNALVKVADPHFLGAAIRQDADCASKSIPKVDPTEPVGIFCLKAASSTTTDEKTAKPDPEQFMVAEYSELDSSLAAKRAPDGTLVFGQANIANHLFSVPFLEKASGQPLPLHWAYKKIPSIDENTGEVKEKPLMGFKLEAFIFDVFSLAEKPLVVQGEREEEFAPLKNASGTLLDSPEYCRKMVLELHGRWFKQIGVQVEGEVEISPLVSYGGEGLEKWKEEKAEKVSGFIEN